MGYIKLWTYNPKEYNEPAQIAYSYKFGWVQLVGALGAFAIIIRIVAYIRGLGKQIMLEDARRKNGPVEELSVMQMATIRVDRQRSWDVYNGALNSISDATVFQTGNVFYEIL